MPERKEKLVLVDGLMVRDTIDDDFHVLHLHPTDKAYYYDHKLYIPRDEIWIDVRYKKEADFLTAVQFFIEDNEIPNHTPYSQVRQMMKEKFCKSGPVPEFEKSRKQVGTHEIVEVDGKTVREYIDPEFFAGGHPLVYNYIPTGEIWYDTFIDAKEIADVLLHEEVELGLMQTGKSYDVAHEYARVHERESRRKRGAIYLGDVNDPWHGLSLEEIINKYYVIG
ncbi:MAG TPA: hypothetical protein VI953_02520 [Candidatus Paceibacterota bacterium]